MSEKIKVYLAKSNRADPSVSEKLRQKLLNSGFEVVEFKGGAYSHDAMLECKFLFIVPEPQKNIGDTFRSLVNTNPIIDEEVSVVVGKGLYNQYEVFTKKYGRSKTYIVTNEDFNLFFPFGSNVFNSNNFVHFGVIECLKNSKESLEWFISKYSTKPTEVNIGDDEKYYILIGKSR